VERNNSQIYLKNVPKKPFGTCFGRFMGRLWEGFEGFGTYFGNNGVGKVSKSQLYWDAFGTGLG
jgi:hypothetical protein